ncbi:MAG TPA: pinensin family lanthipeptide [Longimicrobium sp.]|uniref:pinensin family lanthipeptide n=1 Tax=Longimicrobium sp. TaxID=2029185 RepID=UPI002EDB3E05
MKKLTLDSLEVTSFETSPISTERGTVQGNAQPVSKFNCASILAPCYPTDPNFDCTYGCSRDTGCPDTCVVIDGPVEPVA